MMSKSLRGCASALLWLSSACGDTSDEATPAPKDASTHAADAARPDASSNSADASTTRDAAQPRDAEEPRDAEGPRDAQPDAAVIDAPDAAARMFPPSGIVTECFGTVCPYDECNNSVIFDKPSCDTAYPGPVVATSHYCNANATGTYCLSTQKDADDIFGATWLVTCTNGSATFYACGGCGGTIGEPPTCDD